MAGACTQICKGERGAQDSPAQFARTPDGRKALWCPCCSAPLLAAPVDWTLGAPNVRRDMVKTKELRFEDPVCGYDVVVLRELLAT